LELDQTCIKKGCIASIKDGLVTAEKVGYPIMIKASEGGGGKDIIYII